jgi:sulfur carrier protein ThiS
MKSLTKKTISIEFEGKKYTLQDDITIAEFLTDLGLPKEKPVNLRVTKDGFVLV